MPSSSVALTVLAVAAAVIGGPPHGRAGDPAAAAAEILRPHLGPPSPLAEDFGDYRSPLQFDNGDQVRTADGWMKRRDELLEYWNTQLGPWPELIERPRIEVLREEQRDGLTWKRIRIEYAPEQMPEAWLLLPEGDGPFPAVLVVYYEPETSVGLKEGSAGIRDFGYQLARRGFVTLSIGSPGGDAFRPEIGDAVCQPLSFHAYVSANCWQALAAMSEVDARRIGVTGHSYGGKWAMFSAALWERFAAVAVSDPGIVFDEARPSVNYWEPWYLGLDPDVEKRRPGVPTDENPRTGAYRRLVEERRDLHEIHALIAPRPFLVSGGSEDPPERWQALNHLVAINRLLGYEGRVVMTNRPDHTPTEESNAVLYAFFEQFLQPATDARPAD